MARRDELLPLRAARPAWVPLAGAAVAAALLGTAVDGSQAVATPVALPPVADDLAATDRGASTAAAGTLLLELRDRGAGFTQAVTGLAPGDSAARYVDVVETGTLDGRRLTVLATGTGALAPALQVAVDGCRGGAWEPSSGRCTGTTSRLLSTTPLAALDVPRVLDPLGPARRLSLRVTLSLPDRDEVAANGVLPPQSLQGADARLSWTFRVVQA